jgi:hypothetical protein
LVKGADVKVGDKTIDISDYSFSPDETKLFFAIESEGIYRRSSVENNYVYDLKQEKQLNYQKWKTNVCHFFASW